MTFKGEAVGSIVAEPEARRISEKFEVIEFPLYINRRVKGQSGEYENDPRGTTKVRVILKFDIKDKWSGDLHKGDLIRLKGSIYEREYTRSDGTTGRSLETDFIESIEVISRGKSSDAGTKAPW